MSEQPAVNYLTIEELNVIYALMDTLEQTVQSLKPSRAKVKVYFQDGGDRKPFMLHTDHGTLKCSSFESLKHEALHYLMTLIA